jgi:toxin-antitoxin system PIN domain toxin
MQKTWSDLPDLLDANVWIALSVERHVHHARAATYAADQAAAQLAFCRITELALLRLLSNEAAFADVALDGRSAWAALQKLLATPRVTRIDEPDATDEVLGAWGPDLDIRGRHWTDAYLAAFATAAGCRLVTFDAGFARFPGLTWLHLAA